MFGCDNWHLTHIAAISEEERGIKQTNRRKEETKHFDSVKHFTQFLVQVKNPVNILSFRKKYEKADHGWNKLIKASYDSIFFFLEI